VAAKEESAILDALACVVFPRTQFAEDKYRAAFIEELKLQRKSRAEKLLNPVVKYLNRIFALDIWESRVVDSVLLDSDRWHCKSAFLEKYYAAGNINNIYTAGNEKVIKEFNDIVNIGREDNTRCYCIVRNKKITFRGILWFNNIWNDGRLEYSGKTRIRNFFAGLLWFDNNLVCQPDYKMNLLLSSFFDDAVIEIPKFEKIDIGLEKITSCRAYKNGNVEVSFSSDAAMRQFITAFDLKITE